MENFESRYMSFKSSTKGVEKDKKEKVIDVNPLLCDFSLDSMYTSSIGIDQIYEVGPYLICICV